MARVRFVKPELFNDEELAALSLAARYAFIGLWCHADREGRLECRPLRLKLLVMPYDAVDMAAIINELVAARFLLRYEVAGKAYLQIRSWDKHQRPHMREGASALPAMPQPVQGSAEAQPRQCSAPDEHPTSPLGSGVLILGSGVWTTATDSGDGVRVPPSPVGLELSNGQLQAAAPGLVGAWNNVCAVDGSPFVAVTCRSHPRITAALRDHPDINWWADLFVRVASSDFLRRDAKIAPADLWWVLDHVEEIAAGRYDNRAPVAQTPKAAAPPEWLAHCPHRPPCVLVTQCAEAWEWLKAQQGEEVPA